MSSTAEAPQYLACSSWYNGGLEIVKTHGTINYVGTEAFKGTTWLGNQEHGMVYLDHAAYIYKDAAEGDDPIKLDLPEGTRTSS